MLELLLVSAAFLGLVYTLAPPKQEAQRPESADMPGSYLHGFMRGIRSR